MRKLLTLVLVFSVIGILSGLSYGGVDPDIKPYSKIGGVSGNLNSIGSDTMNNLMTFWAEGFRAVYPNVNIQIEGKGSSTAPPALISGTAQLGPMSREMKPTEIDAFEKKFGYRPAIFHVAIDTIGVYVHKDNPIKGLTLGQLDAIFSTTNKRGLKPVRTWGDLGLTGEWKNRPISLYGRNSASGTYGFFKEIALKGGDFSATVKEQPGSSSVVQGVANDIAGIGYSGIGYRTSGVRAVPISKEETNNFITPSQDTALDTTYPLSRLLYVYVNKKSGEKMDLLTQEFLRFVLSKEGQELVLKDGYYSLPAEMVDQVK